MSAFRSVRLRYWGILLFALLATGCDTSGREKVVKHQIPHLYGTEDPQFYRTMGTLLGRSILEGNRVEVLLNGDEIFPAMLQSIRSAKTTITFETFIYWSGSIGSEFTNALAERARAGVKVHVLLDWIGSNKMDVSQLALMEQTGVEVRKYHKPHWYQLGRLNNRTHRKLLVVDGQIGFTGGVGIADQWSGHAQDPEHWRDSHYRVQGPVVAQMQAVFMDNWIKVSGDVLHGPEYFPPLQPVGTGKAHVFSSSPSGGSESMRLMYLLAITAARHSIHLSTPYFIPDAFTIEALTAATKRGVTVQIITVGPHADSETVRRASRARWGPLLEAGIELHEYLPTMYHCKVMIVDGLWTTVGSTNFDPRSFSLNDEANVNYYDADFARRQIEIFQEDLAHSRQVSFKEWKDRPLAEKIWEHAASLFGSQL
ncbi:MAG: phospholipase D-like domain-containing protein [Desulfuromonadaceae bacterium]